MKTNSKPYSAASSHQRLQGPLEDHVSLQHPLQRWPRGVLTSAIRSQNQKRQRRLPRLQNGASARWGIWWVPLTSAWRTAELLQNNIYGHPPSSPPWKRVWMASSLSPANTIHCIRGEELVSLVHRSLDKVLLLFTCSFMSNSLRPHRQKSTGLAETFLQFLSKNKRHTFHFHQEFYWTTYSPFCSTILCHFPQSYLFLLNKELFQVPFRVFQGTESFSIKRIL